MWLINAETLQLREFFSSQVPKYAILSHTWGKEEVTFQEMTNGSGKRKKGYSKIQKTCRLALRYKCPYAWVDTCCIDKSSSAELSESINSMYQWYERADRCFVWLEDLDRQVAMEDGLKNCRWITRGWTLQELIAPRRVMFFDYRWIFRGSKIDISELLETHTNVPAGLLASRLHFSDFSVAQRMSWASSRSTTRPEDVAYSLLGLFGVNMPLLYGEGSKAFRRLQEEIIKYSNDLTVFAWQNVLTKDLSGPPILFASSPAAFKDSGNITPYGNVGASFSISNGGVFVSGDFAVPPLRGVDVRAADHSVSSQYLLPIGLTNSESDGGVFLRKLGPSIFCRDSRLPLAGFGDIEYKLGGWYPSSLDFYILSDKAIADRHADLCGLLDRYRTSCIHIPEDSLAASLIHMAPGELWDETDRVFLTPNPYDSGIGSRQVVLFMSFEIRAAGLDLKVVLVCFCAPNCSIDSILLERSSPWGVRMTELFLGRNHEKFMLRREFVSSTPGIPACNDHLDITRRTDIYRLSLSFDTISKAPSGAARPPRTSQSYFVPTFRVEKAPVKKKRDESG